MGAFVRKDKVYQYVCPETGKPFYTGHSVDVSKRNSYHRRETGDLGAKLRSYNPPLKPVVIAEFDTRIEAVDREVYHMFKDHTWYTYGGLNFRVGDLPIDFEAQREVSSRCMSRQMQDPAFREKQKVAITKANSNPLVKANASSRMKALFADPDFRKKHSEAAKERMRIRWSNPEYRAEQAERMRKLRADPNFSAKTNAINRERMLRVNKDPEFIAKRDAGNKARRVAAGN
jgi:predicted GIY-YIG superfamily endonuclease